MARIDGGFSLYKRNVGKGKFVYYAKILSNSPTEPERRVSTKQTSKTAAALWTQKYLEDLANDELRQEQERLNITLSEFAVGFWDHDGDYAQSRRARLRTVSKGFLDNRASVTKNHIIPQWGEYRLRDITPKKIDRWVIDMASDNRIAPATINQRLQVLKVILDEACKREHLTDNPSQYVKPVGNHYKEKGVLSLEEVRNLLTPTLWEEYKHYTIALTTIKYNINIS